jgi:hypothetical protein
MIGSVQASENEVVQLPDWQVLEFEEKAFWATARSRLEILPAPDDTGQWELDVQSSVIDNSERVQVNFDPTNGQVSTRSRLSQGKEQRLKSYEYEADFIVRERRNPDSGDDIPSQEWPVTSRKELPYPTSAADTVVTSPYLLVLLAQQLQAQGPGKSLEVLVHTDLNFYRVHLTSGNGIPINANYKTAGGDTVSGTRETLAVAVLATPELTAEDKNDFDLLGLNAQIILFFDRSSGLLLQVRGQAPRIGATEINLKSVTMRDAG